MEDLINPSRWTFPLSRAVAPEKITLSLYSFFVWKASNLNAKLNRSNTRTPKRFFNLRFTIHLHALSFLFNHVRQSATFTGLCPFDSISLFRRPYLDWLFLQLDSLDSFYPRTLARHSRRPLPILSANSSVRLPPVSHRAFRVF